ncbi:MMPL family transporter [Geothrix sp. PMB-07]|uniref:MMPL family transporter n=1 Tax=Geothrix sp. PMB-07 TaxID=3068640 RepID=UPI0027419E0B|nr:MMPL family transporter [Geothrix sp. PMB-07]WLT31109.1 MMPL family transporter [Geothrix sp. PMB-07]
MLKGLLRHLLRLHLRHPRPVAGCLLALTLGLGWGAFRVERRLDIRGLFPQDSPVVQNSLRAGVGSEELVWLAAEGSPQDLETRKKWLEQLADRLCTEQVPLNGLTPEGRLAEAVSVPGPEGAALWPPLLAAGALAAGDEDLLKALGQRAYRLAPLVLGHRLDPLLEPEAASKALTRSVEDLRGLDPVQARLAILDPLRLREGLDRRPYQKAASSMAGFPFRLGGSSTLVSRDGRWALLPLVLRFPTDHAKGTTRVVAWLAQGAQGPLPEQASLAAMKAALAPDGTRPFALQVTGAHPIAAYESSHLTREIGRSLVLSFLLIGLVYALGFRTLSGYGFILVPLLAGILWGLGILGLLLGRLNLLVAVFGVVLLGVGDDIGILLFSRYLETREAGRTKASALKAMLVGTGPGVLAGGLTLSAAFLAFAAAPLPALREVGLTIGLGFLTCLAASFLVMPSLLLAFDRGDRRPRRCGAPRAPRPQGPHWRPWVAAGLVALAMAGAAHLRWEQDLRAFRRNENPAMALQERLGQAVGTGLQALALHIDLVPPGALPGTWNRAAKALQREGLPFPDWQPSHPTERPAQLERLLPQAVALGLDEAFLRSRIEALTLGTADPAGALATFAARGSHALQIPLRLDEAAQERVQNQLVGSQAMLVGTRPLAQALKALAKQGLTRAIVAAILAMAFMLAAFGRDLRFGLLALVPILASVVGALGAMGLAGVPLGFLSLCALPIAMAVSVDLTMNLLHRARLEPLSVTGLGRVNAVCAGTTLAGFGGFLFSGHGGLRGLGLAAAGGTALALLTIQWLLPPLLERWPLARQGQGRKRLATREGASVRAT